MRLSPTRALLGWLAGATLLSVIPAVWPTLTVFWLVAAAVWLAWVVWDAVVLSRCPLLTVERRIVPALPLGVWRSVSLRVGNIADRPAVLTLFDHYPMAAAQLSDLPQRLVVAPGGWTELHYRLRPVTRGAWTFPYTQVLLESPRGWWRREDRLGAPETVWVYPDFAVIAQELRLAADRREALLGIHRRRRRGEGQTFLQLREYRIGDSLRQIDWKATARIRKLIAKDYQDERHQTVLFLLDCGRRMRAQDGELSHFDHALNALILLAYVALRQGDAVGVQSFGGERRWLAPRAGVGALPLLINGLYDVQPGLEPPDYTEAVQRTLTRQRKRALIVLLTNLRDEDQEELGPALALLRRRHLVLVANLREQVLDELVTRPIHDLAQARLYTGACDYLLRRERVQEALRQRGGIVLDTPPERLPAAMVEHYLDLKRSGRL